MSQTINVTGLKPEQVAQIRAIIEAFRAKNQLDNSYPINEENLNITPSENSEPSALFFDSEILEPFNRSRLYEQRS